MTMKAYSAAPKRWLAVLALTAAAVLLMTVGAFAASDISLSEASSLAEDFLSEYYYALHQFEDYDFSPYIQSENLLEHINMRIESAWQANQLVDTPEKTEYSLETEVKESDDLGDRLRLFVAVRASYKFPDTDFTSGSGEGVYLLIVDTDDGLKIADWYIPHEPYLEAVRGNLTEVISDPGFWDSDLTAESIYSNQEAWDESLALNAVEINAAREGLVLDELTDSVALSGCSEPDASRVNPPGFYFADGTAQGVPRPPCTGLLDSLIMFYSAR